MPKPGAMIYYSILPAIKTLSMEERGQLLTAILEYGSTDKSVQFDGPLSVAWAFIKPMLDKDTAHYENVCNARKKAISKRWDKDKNTNDTNVYNCIEKNSFDTNSNCSCNINTNINNMQHTKSVSKVKILRFCEKHNIPESFGNDLYERYSPSGWTDQNGKPIQSIQKFLLRAWEDEKSKAEPENGNLINTIRERQRAERENSCTPDDLVEYPYGSGRYRPKKEVEAMDDG